MMKSRTPSPTPSHTSSDLFSNFSLAGFDNSTKVLTSPYTRTISPDISSPPPLNTSNNSPTVVPSIIVSLFQGSPATAAATSPPPAPAATSPPLSNATTPRSLRSRLTLGKNHPSSTYTPHHLQSRSISAPLTISNPLRRRSSTSKAEDVAFAQRMEERGGPRQPPPFDPQYLGGVKPLNSMISLAEAEHGWVKPASDGHVVDGPSVSVSPANGRGGKGGPGWYAGKRKNDKGEIVAIGEDGVEVVIMKLPPKKTSARLSRSPSPHPPPSMPLPPLPPVVDAPAPTEKDEASALAEDLPMALIREIISLSPSRSGDGSGYFDVYGKEKISPEAGRRPSESSTSSAEGSSSSGSNESSEYVRRGSTVTFISKAERVVLNQKRICEALITSRSAKNIPEEDEEDQRTPVPSPAPTPFSPFSTFEDNDATPTNETPNSEHTTPPLVFDRKTSLCAPYSPPSSPLRRIAFGTRSNSPPASSSSLPGLLDDARSGTPTKYKIVAHHLSEPAAHNNSSDDEGPVSRGSLSSTPVVSPQAWAETVAASSQEDLPPRRSSIQDEILWDEEEKDSPAVSPSTSTSIVSSSMVATGGRSRAPISPSFETNSTLASSDASSSSISHHHRHNRGGSFSSSSDTCQSSAPTSSSTLATTPSSTTFPLSPTSSKIPIKTKKNNPANLVLNIPPPLVSPTTNASEPTSPRTSLDGASSTSSSHASHKQALLTLRRLHTLEKDALIFALSESQRALDQSRAENESLRIEVKDLGSMMEEIRRALLEEESLANGASISSLLGGGGKDGVLMMSHLNSSASSLFPSLNGAAVGARSSTGSTRKWDVKPPMMGGGGAWDDEEEEPDFDDEDGEEMGEMLLSLPLPPRTHPAEEGRRSLDLVEGGGAWRRSP